MPVWLEPKVWKAERAYRPWLPKLKYFLHLTAKNRQTLCEALP